MTVERASKELPELIWEVVPDSRVRRTLGCYYDDVQMCMEAMFEGQEIHTPFAIYRIKRER